MEFRSHSREDSPGEAERLRSRLKNLYLENADEEFLTVAANHLDRLVGTPFDTLYDEIADRALCSALSSGESKRIQAVVRVLRAAAAERPMARLAQAVLHIAAGRIAEAREHLEGVRGGPVIGEDIAEWLEDIVPPLRVLSLAGGDSVERSAAKMSPEVTAALRTLSRPLSRQLQDYLRLERSLWHHYQTPGLAELPQTVGLRSPEGRLLWSFFRTLKGFRIGTYRPGPRTVRKLEQVLEEAQKSQLSKKGYRELLDAAEERLWLFQRLLDLERALGRTAPPVEEARRRLREFLIANHHRLVRLLARRPPALLGNLEFAWRHRWHELLDKLGKDFDGSMWSEFYAFRPQVLSHHLVPLRPHPGAQQAMWHLWIDRLLRGEKYHELAEFLAGQSRADTFPPHQLVRLWACELWTWRRVLGGARHRLERSASGPQQPAAWAAMLPPATEVPEVRHLLTRLREMTYALKQRFAIGKRTEVARVLRDETLHLAAQFGFSRDLKPLVEALLELLPSDLGLVIIGIAAAQGSGDEQTPVRFTARPAGRKSSAADLVPLLPLLKALVAAPARHAEAAFKEAKKCLEGAGWDRLEGFLRLEIRQRLLADLWDAAGAQDVHRLASLDRVEQTLRGYRPLVGDAMDLAAAQEVVTCWTAAASQFTEPGRQFFERFGSLEASVVLFCYVGAVVPGEHEGLDRLRELSLETIIARLDLVWSVWQPAIPLLALRLSPAKNDRFCQRIEGLLASGSPTLEESRSLRAALEHLRKFRDLPRVRGAVEIPLPSWEHSF